MADTAEHTGAGRRVDGERGGRRLTWAGWTLGFALGGFFDGILLHQILQWHHLLSGLQGEAFADLRVQVVADGLFHALMYVVALVGLWLLWKARHALAHPGSERLLVADILIGFGAWHILDSIASHWVLGIHRIRMDSDMPLVWDLIWFVVFGVAAIVAGWMLRRSTDRGGPRRRGGAGVPASVIIAVIGAGMVAALPPPASSTVVVVFGPAADPEGMVSALAAVDGRMIWTDRSGMVWAIDVAEDAATAVLYSHGAVLVSRGLLPLGCLEWMQA
jgi:uncharacterized membrane protein